MRTLKYAILGMLSRRELTGYDMMKEFDRGLANFWYASHSQLYPELKRLAGEGLIQYETSIKGESLEKKIYRITPEGMADLRQWLEQDEPLPPHSQGCVPAADVFWRQHFPRPASGADPGPAGTPAAEAGIFAELSGSGRTIQRPL